MRPSLSLWAFAFFVLTTHAVKEYLFKDCQQSGFCSRNRHYAGKIARTGSVSPYTIDPNTVSVNETHISGLIAKELPGNGVVHFPWEISVLDGDSIRFKVDEHRDDVPVKNIDSKRYAGAVDAAFDGLPESKTRELKPGNVKTSKSGFTYAFGPADSYELEVQYSPIRIAVLKDGQQQVVINEKNFLNIEHFRTESENSAHINRQLESDFDMFHDSFGDSKNDRLPLGPEAVAVDVELVGFSHAYGIPEHADSLNLKDTTDTNWPYRLFNVDIFEYETDSRMPMYGSIPLLVGVKPGSAVGVFWANSADTFVDLRKSDSTSAHWMSENGVLDMVVIIGEQPADINLKYGLLTGFTPLPQEFALGYHQCRWNYNDVEDVLGIAAQMDEHLFPFDTIWLDIEYADRKQYFTWNPSTFARSVEMMEELDATGRNLVVIIDPHLKTGYEVSDYVENHHIGIKDADNATYKGHCWPGESLWIDSMNPSAQAYWDKLFAYESGSFLSQQTNVHLWNDMNEPSFFNGPESSSPRDNLHYGDIEHRSVHNLWGKTFHELTHNSLVKRLANTNRQRPFILTRSYFAGSQRTAAMWTGDNMATWDYLESSIPMVLTSNVVNMPFAGADVGGFFGDPSKELLTRWYQTGIWYPFFRAHAHIDSRRREPWIPGEPYSSIMRDAVKLRYSLLPTLYTLFHDTSIDGTPIWRPMFYESPKDQKTYGIEDQFFMGNSGLLVKPVTEEGCGELSVYIPEGEVYYDYTNGEFKNHTKITQSGYIDKTVSLSDIPIFVKGGSIFAKRERYRRSSKLMRRDPYSLIVAFNKMNTAYGSLYVDDGESYGYQEGKYLKASFAGTEGKMITSTSVTGDEHYAISLKDIKVEKITIAGSVANVEKITVVQNDKSWSARFNQRDDIVEVLNPGINIVDDWAIEISERDQDHHDEL
ncbi:hypothetical protein JCM33374_g1199 [Metschnikowia sp. JCM 33374]|nr:hypothetical protein JCM33374_g1199 [Metschnikowia sp. JCM 33374]